MVTGGAPNNTLTLLKFERAAKSKNPFNYKDRLYEDPLNKEMAGVGPGLYSPQYSGQIGGSDLEKLKIRVNQNSTTLTANDTEISKGSPAAKMINSGSGASVSAVDNLNRMTRGQSFGSSTARFD